MIRQSRVRRRKGIRVRLTERDREVLLALTRFRLARTSQLYRYAFAGIRRDTAAVRLRRLFDSRHVSVLRSGPLAENLYRLGPVGRQALQAEGVRLGPSPRGAIEHHLGVVESWTRLAGESGVAIARCLPDWELREELGLGELAIIPDLFALVRLNGQLVPIAIEVDCGTESASVLRSKAERYAALWGRSPGLFGWERFALLVVVLSPQRRAVAASALKKVWVLPHAITSAQEPLSPALLPLLAQLQPPLAASPCPNGRPGVEVRGAS
jgi:protein involved in plasmid replication-relaxation